MSCGCSRRKVPRGTPPKRVIGPTPAQQGRIVVCAQCSRGDGRGYCKHERAGPISGRCPLGKFGPQGSVYWPTIDGLVGPRKTIRWMGAPWPLRFMFWINMGRWPRVPGCGCIWRLKTLWLRILDRVG